MRLYTIGLILAILTGTVCSQTIRVDAGSIVRVFNHHPVGINVNYLMDDDTYLKPEIPVSQALKEMKVGMIRYPGGEKSDNYLWSVPPYDAANPHFATRGSCNWPNGDNRFSSDAIKPRDYTLDFDEFMGLCADAGAEPLIVVSGDAHLCDVCPTAPTLDTLIRNAVEWIHYANIVHDYNIKYWVVGNESFHSAAYGTPGTAQQYANDFVRFARAMKAVDSGICVVANTRAGEWVNTLMDSAAGYVDAVALSNYPIWDWKNGYEDYRKDNPSFVTEIQSVSNSIGQRNIKIIVTEYAPIDWSNSWPKINDLGHALVSFQMFGDMIKMPGVQDACFWNTRWVDNNKTPQEVYDAIDADGHLNATGKALSIWGNYLFEKLLYTTNSGMIRSFATMDTTGKRINIFLINKDNISHTVVVGIDNWPAFRVPNLGISEFYLSGTSDEDKFPVFSTPEVNSRRNASSLMVEVNPLSIHIVSLDANAETNLDHDLLQTNGMRIYPNPVKSLLHVGIDLTLSKSCGLKICNLAGMTVYETIVNNMDTPVNLSELPGGIYILSLGDQRRKFIKM